MIETVERKLQGAREARKTLFTRPVSLAVALTILVAFMLGASIARLGEAWSTHVGVGLLAAALVLAVALANSVRRALKPADVLRLFSPVQRPEAERAYRALSLLDAPSAEPLSRELALRHITQAWDALDLDLLATHMAAPARRAGRWLAGALLLAAAALGYFRLALVEGMSVAASRDGIGGIPLDYFEQVSIRVTMPEYLRIEPIDVGERSAITVPVGSILEVRARPAVSDRMFVVVTSRSTPLTQDGHGNLVARVEIRADQRLFIGALFGNTAVVRAPAIEVRAISDSPPTVVVDGAPATKRLVSDPRVDIRYRAIDDHGLKEVNLVLRSVDKEERRLISDPPSDVKEDLGGTTLWANDPFFRKAFAPVEVTVEARDNDSVSGPKWGRSQPLVVMVPTPGEREAQRFAVLAAQRDAWVDLLGKRLSQAPNIGSPIRSQVVPEQEHLRDSIIRQLAELSPPLRGPIRALLADILDSALRVAQELPDAPATSYPPPLIKKTEDGAMAWDAALSFLDQSDAKTVAKRLASLAAQIALELAPQEGQLRTAAMRRQAMLLALNHGAADLHGLGPYGKDLAQVVAIGQRRILRPLEQQRFREAEIAARDLAARLKDPDRSLMGGSGNAESGQGQGPPNPSEGKGSGMDDALQALESLAREHAQLMVKTQRDGPTPELSDEESAMAKRARDLLGDLPPETLDALREAADKMDEASVALKNGDGHSARKAQGDAQRSLERALGPRPPPEDEQASPGSERVLGKEDHESPEEFRRRVLEGLRQTRDSSLRENVRRYAEELLR